MLDALLVIIDKEIEMGKKLKALTGNLTENQLALTVKDSAQQIWLAGLGAFAKAQQEGGKVFNSLVKEGETIQARTRQISDEKVAALTSRAAGTWDRLEQVFEDRVARALGRLGVPSKKEIDKLAKRVAELTAVVDGLASAQAAASKPERKPARKRVVKATV
ncbi:MAG: poly(hydroxyalkanoate) granule-associated protein [Proteobacteria bacterium]|nr:poly(hydroxyalkanoate) granule-associated protein [Pseudomonadota bacterium]